MSDHFDNDDLRTDLTDLYVFPAATPDRTVLIVDVNPEASTAGDNVDPAASYELKIDLDGDELPDVAFHVAFASSGREATATVYRSTGPEARGSGRIGDVIVPAARVSSPGHVEVSEAGGYRFFAGLRSDPHFKDVEGFRNNFEFTGRDPVADRNVFGIALEVPNADLGEGRPIRVWARTMAETHGTFRQVDQIGRPGINNAFNEDEADNAAFCRSSPHEQRALFADKFVAFLRSLGYDEAKATEVALGLLPDWLVYDPAMPCEYPNGRRLTDDTADALASLLTNGRITSDTVGPHTDLLAEFPYLGPPRPDGAVKV